MNFVGSDVDEVYLNGSRRRGRRPSDQDGCRKRNSRRCGQERRDGLERQDGQNGLADGRALSLPALPPIQPFLPYFFVESTGFGVGLSTYSFRNHTCALLRVTFTHRSARRRFVASGFFE